MSRHELVLVVTEDLGAVTTTPDTFPGRKAFRCVTGPTNGGPR